MIDRSIPSPCFRPAVHGYALAVALALTLMPPVLALVCIGGGWLLWLLLWAVNLLGGLVVILLVLGGVIGMIGGLGRLIGGKVSVKGQGAGICVLGVVAFGLGGYGLEWWARVAWIGLRAEASHDREAALRGADWLTNHIWLGHMLWLWPWLIPATSIIGAGLACVLIGMLRWYEAGRSRLARIHFACPLGHRAGVAFACASCGAWEERLTPSVHGILAARCACGHAMRTSDLFDRHLLRKRCRRCRQELDHPELGRRPEFHVAVWGSSDSDKSVWLQAAVDRLGAAGALISSIAAGGLPGVRPPTLLSGGGLGAGLLYIYDLPSASNAAVGSQNESGAYDWIDAGVLVLPMLWDENATRTVAALLEYGERRWPAAVARRAPAPLAVLVQGVSAEGRAAIDTLGREQLASSLEARFRHVAFFSSGAAEAPLQWVGRNLAGG